MITLYGYFRSSAAYRVRIALNLKQITYQHKTVHLVRNGGEQHEITYESLNPSKLVPTLIDDENVLTQSLSIIEYLDEAYPNNIDLLPKDINQKAQVRTLSQIISSDIHPINNLRVLSYLTQELSVDDDKKNNWYSHWIQLGFEAIEKQLTKTAGQFCVGDQPTMADCCLVPQIYNALRFNVDLTPYPKINQIYINCMLLDAFQKAIPENQPDAA